jgi:hypothetical protein
VSLGALAINAGYGHELILGSSPGGASATFYRLRLRRESNGTPLTGYGLSPDNRSPIIGFDGPATVFAKAPSLASGATFGPLGMLVYTIEAGSAGVDVGSIAAGSKVSAYHTF